METLRKAAKALLNYIDADCHSSIDRTNSFEALVDDLKDALNNHIIEAKAMHPDYEYLDESTEE